MAKPPKPEPPPPVPEFTSDRLRMLAPIVTARCVALARERVLTGEHFFYKDALSPAWAAWVIEEAELKLVLILVLEMNPREDLDNNEQGALRGMTRALYAKQSSRGELKR